MKAERKQAIMKPYAGAKNPPTYSGSIASHVHRFVEARANTDEWRKAWPSPG